MYVLRVLLFRILYTDDRFRGMCIIRVVCVEYEVRVRYVSECVYNLYGVSVCMVYLCIKYNKGIFVYLFNLIIKFNNLVMMFNSIVKILWIK